MAKKTTKKKSTDKKASTLQHSSIKPLKLKKVVTPDLQFEATNILLTQAPSPAKMAGILRRVDAGEIGLLCKLQEEMESKSAQFQGLCETRRNALTGLDWCIEPDQDLVTDIFANEVAEYSEEILVGLPTFDEAINHLATAIGANVALLEKVWVGAELADLTPVPYTRLQTNQLTNLGIAVKTPSMQNGIDVESMPNKFVVYHRHWNGGFPFRRTLTHASILPFLFINLSQKDWAAYSELFGQPLRWGKAPIGSDDEVLNILRDMLENMGSDTAGMFPADTELGFLQSQGTGETYQRQLDYADTKMAILWLGQNLTSQVSQQGSRAAAETHNKIRGDLLKADIRAEATCIRNQILAPMVELAFPGQEAPIPYFVRKVETNRDVEGERADLEKIKLAQALGLEVTTEWLYGALRIPKPPIELPITMKLEAKLLAPKLGPDGKPLAPGDDAPLDKAGDKGKNPKSGGDEPPNAKE